ncbi:hypothetical protein [Actinomyces sp. oral taxon 181]|uniref:hypothetical protein n=1 Tax=Actinomyces sp. oral taxon 181 TaxID=712121 RepID=UPI0025B98575|nr:hypothetical protein [Actinomyces sp. oral taxon 181]MBS5749764.1 hypothetical protein [Actinomyces sp. oral taxon 181]
MALFEFDEGRLIPAQFGRSVSDGLTPEIVDAVCNQVLEIVSRPLFPITWRDISPFEGSAFVDGSAEDEAPRLTALDPSGQVVSVEILDFLDSDTLIQSLSRLAGTAALSWSDLAREYPGGVAAFKSGWIHFRDSMPPSPGAGPRLVMVVGRIDPAVRPALEVLAASGVEVHEMSLREMSNGRSFLEVHAVGPRTYAHAPHLLAGRSDDVPAIASSIREVPAPVTIESSAGVDFVSSEPAADAETIEPQAPEVEAEHVLDGSDVHHHAAPVVGEDGDDDLEEESEELRAAREAGIPILSRDAAALRVLGQIIAEDVPAIIVNVPQAECEFTADGLFRSGEETWDNPQDALSYFGVSGNGWTLWHLGGEEGPTLGESLAEVNREIIREYSRD